jgi:hypothetical protein
MDTLQVNGEQSPQEQATRVDALAQEVSERLTALADQHIQLQAQLEAFQQLLRQQGNSILAYTVERVQVVLERNFRVARQQLDASIYRQSAS